MLDRAARLVAAAIDYVIGFGLALMVALVFANVVARYAFNSGIVVSEELSRFLFVWLVFLGAVVAMREHAHLGVDSLVRRLSPTARKFCFMASTLAMLAGCAIMGLGSLHHMELGHSNVSAVTGIPQSFVFAAGLVAAVGVAAVLLRDLYLLAAGRLAVHDLVQVKGEEDQP